MAWAPTKKVLPLFLTLPPAPKLAPFVHAYWFIEDLPGKHMGSPIHTSPIPGAILGVTLGRPNRAQDGSPVPKTCLLGLQSHSRTWYSCPDTYFVMAMLTVPGLLRLFPHTGSASANQIVDLGALVGDRQSRALSDTLTAAAVPGKIAAALDRWLMMKLDVTATLAETGAFGAAYDILRRGGSVSAAARSAATDRRQLLRWFTRHLGLGPKAVADLERFQNSLKSVQTRKGDPFNGFSDQAHQIRTWRRKLNMTPSAYQGQAQSILASYFSANGDATEPVFYL